MKNLSNLGKTLNKAEQKEINGGMKNIRCQTNDDCPSISSGVGFRLICDQNIGICVQGIFG